MSNPNTFVPDNEKYPYTQGFGERQGRVTDYLSGLHPEYEGSGSSITELLNSLAGRLAGGSPTSLTESDAGNTMGYGLRQGSPTEYLPGLRVDERGFGSGDTQQLRHVLGEGLQSENSNPSLTSIQDFARNVMEKKPMDLADIGRQIKNEKALKEILRLRAQEAESSPPADYVSADSPTGALEAGAGTPVDVTPAVEPGPVSVEGGGGPAAIIGILASLVPDIVGGLSGFGKEAQFGPSAEKHPDLLAKAVSPMGEWWDKTKYGLSNKGLAEHYALATHRPDGQHPALANSLAQHTGSMGLGSKLAGNQSAAEEGPASHGSLTTDTSISLPTELAKPSTANPFDPGRLSGAESQGDVIKRIRELIAQQKKNTPGRLSQSDIDRIGGEAYHEYSGDKGYNADSGQAKFVNQALKSALGEPLVN